MDSILDFILDGKAEYMNQSHVSRPSHHPLLIAYSVVPVLIIQTLMDFFRQCVGI